MCPNVASRQLLEYSLAYRGEENSSMARKMALPIALLLMATCAATCFAQAEQGTITGVVVDASGASVPKAKITAVNQATGATAAAETTDEGYYRLPYLHAGKYRVSV